MDFNEGGAAAGGDGGQGGGGAADLLGVAAAGATSGDAGAAAGGDAGGGGAAGAGEVAGGPDPEWYKDLSADVGEGESASLRDWVKSKGFKDINGMVRAHLHAEKAIHDRGAVKVPGEGAKPEEVAAFHKAIGVPDDAKGYELAEIKDAAGNPVPMNTPVLDRLAATAHKAGVPKAAYEALVNDYVQAQLEEMSTLEASETEAGNAKIREWGDKAGANQAAIGRAVEALGLGRDETIAIRRALGPARAADVFLKLGNGLAEDTLVTGGGGQRFGITGEQAQAQLNAMRSDPAIQDKVRVPGSPERLRWDNLQKIVGDAADRARAATGG